MFVAVTCDLANEDHSSRVHATLLQYGFKRVQDKLYESLTIGERGLLRLKKDLDRLTDSYDALRFYQYPVENTLVISTLKDKKWRKIVVNSPSAGTP